MLPAVELERRTRELMTVRNEEHRSGDSDAVDCLLSLTRSRRCRVRKCRSGRTSRYDPYQRVEKFAGGRKSGRPDRTRGR